MIVFRYLARSVLANTIGVTAVLMLVVISSRFVKYLAEAAAGKLEAGVLLAIIAFRMPGFVELVLPLAFFLSILLAYGQLYEDSEMTVLRACGISEKGLVVRTFGVALLVAAVVGVLSLYASPAGFARVESLINAQKLRGEVESLTPGRFYPLRGDKGVTYAEQISDDGMMSDVFLAQSGGSGDADSGLVIVVSDRGFSRKSKQTGDSYLVLTDGKRIQGTPGKADFMVTRFEEFGQRLDPVILSQTGDQDATSTASLWGSENPADRATLQWRISLPVMVLIVTLLAVPLSRTNPRQGRFVKILPAVLLYLIYLLSLNGARGMIEDEKSWAEWSMALIHSAFAGLGLLLVAINSGWQPLRAKLPAAGVWSK